MSLFIRVLVCIGILGVFLYCYINKQNAITQLRLEIPAVAKELKVLEQENTRLQFEIDRFENPVDLMEVARQPEFSHLKYPMLNEIVTIPIPAEEEG